MMVRVDFSASTVEENAAVVRDAVASATTQRSASQPAELSSQPLRMVALERLDGRGVGVFCLIQGVLRAGDRIMLAGDPNGTQWVADELRDFPGGGEPRTAVGPGSVVGVKLRPFYADQTVCLRRLRRFAVAGRAELDGLPLATGLIAVEAHGKFAASLANAGRRLVRLSGYGGETLAKVVHIAHHDADSVVVVLRPEPNAAHLVLLKRTGEGGEIAAGQKVAVALTTTSTGGEVSDQNGQVCRVVAAHERFGFAAQIARKLQRAKQQENPEPSPQPDALDGDVAATWKHLTDLSAPLVNGMPTSTPPPSAWDGVDRYAHILAAERANEALAPVTGFADVLRGDAPSTLTGRRRRSCVASTPRPATTLQLVLERASAKEASRLWADSLRLVSAAWPDWNDITLRSRLIEGRASAAYCRRSNYRLAQGYLPDGTTHAHNAPTKGHFTVNSEREGDQEPNSRHVAVVCAKSIPAKAAATEYTRAMKAAGPLLAAFEKLRRANPALSGPQRFTERDLKVVEYAGLIPVHMKETVSDASRQNVSMPLRPWMAHDEGLVNEGGIASASVLRSSELPLGDAWAILRTGRKCFADHVRARELVDGDGSKSEATFGYFGPRVRGSHRTRTLLHFLLMDGPPTASARASLQRLQPLLAALDVWTLGQLLETHEQRRVLRHIPGLVPALRPLVMAALPPGLAFPRNNKGAAAKR